MSSDLENLTNPVRARLDILAPHLKISMVTLSSVNAAVDMLKVGALVATDPTTIF